MATPYITPDMLRQADTGIDWPSLVEGHEDDSITEDEISRICIRVSSMADIYCNQILRATIDTEQLGAPSERVGIRPNGLVRFPVSRWPVIAVNSVETSLSSGPLNFQLVPDTQYFIENMTLDTASGEGAYSIIIQPGWVSWFNGRNGYQIRVKYTNGFPNASLIAPVLAGSMAIPVSDLTGYLANTNFTIYDGADTEQVAVLSSDQISGPGNITLTSPLAFPHSSGVLVSALPAAVQQSCIYLATYVALTRGATALALPPVSGHSSAGAGAPDNWLLTEAYSGLEPFRRIF